MIIIYITAGIQIRPKIIIFGKTRSYDPIYTIQPLFSSPTRPLKKNKDNPDSVRTPFKVRWNSVQGPFRLLGPFRDSLGTPRPPPPVTNTQLITAITHCK